MNLIHSRLDKVTFQIHQAEKKAGLKKGTVRLIAVTKTRTVEEIITAYEWGQRAFAENYVQEALPKIKALRESRLKPEWHFIGKLQSNKIAAIAENFDWVETLDNQAHAKQLQEKRHEKIKIQEKKIDSLTPLNICFQLHIPEYTQPSGITLRALSNLIDYVLTCQNLVIRGLMCMLKPNLEIGQQYEGFKQCFQAFHSLKTRYPTKLSLMDTLSMGMSEDFKVAIECGATAVRIGTAIFGNRS